MKRYIYLDYAAATPVAVPVLRAMKPFFSDRFGNPSSMHSAGKDARVAVTESRAVIARALHALLDEIIFTSGGTESINLALRGSIAAVKKPSHIISTTIEHAATLETLDHLKASGHTVTLAPVDRSGIVTPRAILSAITPATKLISLIYVQNEIGTIQPIAEIGRALIGITRERKKKKTAPILFHVDACQAPAFLPIDIQKIHADLVTLDGGKMYGPKGIGLLYIKKGTPLMPIIFGGGQERDFRSGTENVPLIVGLATAFRYVETMRRKETYRITALREYMVDMLAENLPVAVLSGDRKNRIANNVHITLPDIEGEQLVLYLDRAGIAASTGSACSTGEGSDSHVMKALGLPKNRIAGSLRFSLGYRTKKFDIDRALAALISIVRRLQR